MKTSPMLIVSEDEHVFLLNEALPMAENREQVAAVLRYATGLVVEPPKPDGGLLVFAGSPRVEQELGSWMHVEQILAAVAAGDFDDESGAAVVMFATRRALAEDSA